MAIFTRMQHANPASLHLYFYYKFTSPKYDIKNKKFVALEVVQKESRLNKSCPKLLAWNAGNSKFEGA
jgi:hypothetical protein